MILVYSKDNQISSRVGGELIKNFGFEKSEERKRAVVFRAGDKLLVEIEGRAMDAGFLDSEFSTDCFVFLYSHFSSAGVAAMTVHPEGNWSEDNSIGGLPMELGCAAPMQMFSALRRLSANRIENADVTYEATHHGPLLKTPSFFMEVGGTDSEELIKELCRVLALSAFEISYPEKSMNKVVLGIGGGHYPKKFTRMAIENGVAFAHIMSKHSIDSVKMLGQAISRSEPRPSEALIEWKSLNSNQRKMVVDELDHLGIRYERV